MDIKDGIDSKMYRTVASNIKKYRVEKDISLATLSEYADIEQAYLEQLENLKGDVTISIYDLYKISVILEVSIDKFFKE